MSWVTTQPARLSSGVPVNLGVTLGEPVSADIKVGKRGSLVHL